MSMLRPFFNGKRYCFISFGIHRAEDIDNAWKTLHTFGQKVATGSFWLGSVANDFVFTYITAGPDSKVPLHSLNGCSFAGVPD